MSASDEARSMLEVAVRDYQTLIQMANPGEFSTAAFGLFAQQTVEKALKAWILASGSRYPYSHDIQLLVDQLVRSGEELPTNVSRLERLTDFAMQFRYIVGNFEDELPDRPAVLIEVNELLVAVMRRLAQ